MDSRSSRGMVSDPPGPRLTNDQRCIAVFILWILSGDAGQRALVAWSMGWQSAQQASGSHWMGSYFAQLLEDPYDAVRFAAYRSLRQLPDKKVGGQASFESATSQPRVTPRIAVGSGTVHNQLITLKFQSMKVSSWKAVPGNLRSPSPVMSIDYSREERNEKPRLFNESRCSCAYLPDA